MANDWTMKKTSKPKAADTAKEEVRAGGATYLDLGRTNQKMRTRDALVTVAAEMIRSGQEVSVTAVADFARVSRTTAYRYFPTSEMLAVHATLAAANVGESQQIEKVALGPGAAEEKLDAVIVGSHAMTMAHEAAFRSMLRFTVEAGKNADQGLPRRPTFRRTWIEGALSPVKKDLGHQRFTRLAGTLCLLCGIEPVIVLSDICQMSSEEACEAKRWAAKELLRAALREAAAGKSRDPKAKQAK